jgi:signal transduction histidine kinase
MLSELEAERRRAYQAEQFAATLGRIGAARSLEEALAVLARDAIALLGGEQGAVRAYGLEGETPSLAFWVGPDGALEPAEYPETVPGTVAGELRAGGPARVIRDLWELEPGLSESEKQVKRRGMRSSVAVPITVRRVGADGISAESRRIGSLHVDHHEVGFFGEGDVAVAEALATMAGAAIERAQLEERVRRLVREQVAREEAEAAQRCLVLLGEVSNALSASLEYETTLRTAVALVVPALADHCAIDVLQPDGRLHRLVTGAGDPDAQAAAAELAVRFPPETRPDHPVLRVLRTGTPEVYADLPAETIEEFVRDPDELTLVRRLAPRSSALVPLVARGKTLGALTVGMGPSGRRFTSADLPVLTELARRFAVAMDNAHLYREAQDQASTHVQLNAALRQAMEARDEALAQAESALGLRDKFLQLASHELRTPITSLRGYAQLLLRQYRRQGNVDPEQVQRALRLIDHQSDKLARLAIQLLDTSRIESGRFSLERRETDLASLVREVVDSTKEMLALNAPVLQVEFPITLEVPESCPAEVDRARLEQVLINLLDNALKYSPNGGQVDVRMARHTNGADRWAELSVRDRGIGVPPQHRELIFDRFYQVQKRDNPSGMGLGLYVSRQIVEAHGGTLTAEFPPDGGSRFLMTLPLSE